MARLASRACGFAAGALALVLALVLAAGASGEPAAAEGSTLRILGGVAQPLTLGPDDLRRCPQRDVEIAPPAERPGMPAPAPRRYTGCLMRDLLASAKPVDTRPRDLRRSYLVVTARDGYQVVFSWAELFISPVGDGALVAHTRDGAPLGRDEGPLALVSGSDTRAARHVKGLQSLDLRTAGSPPPEK